MARKSKQLNKVGATRRENGEDYTAPPKAEPDSWDRWYAKVDEEMKRKSLTKTPSEALLSRNDVEIAHDVSTNTVLILQAQNKLLLPCYIQVDDDVSVESAPVVGE